MTQTFSLCSGGSFGESHMNPGPFFRGMEPIYAQSDNTLLMLTRANVSGGAEEVARVVARSPVDQLEHAYAFDDANAYLAWSVASEAQRRAAYHGYDPTEAGIEAIVLAPHPEEYHGRLSAFFDDAPAAWSSDRLMIYRQNLTANGVTMPGPFYTPPPNTFSGNPGTNFRGAGRMLLDDILKAEADGAESVGQVLADTGHPHTRSTGFVNPRKGRVDTPKPLPSPATAETGPVTPTSPPYAHLPLVQLDRVDLPKGYAREDYYADVDAVRVMMDGLAEQAGEEARGQDYDAASQAYAFAADLKYLYQDLCHGRHRDAINAMNRLSPYLVEDLPYRLYEELEHHLKELE